jgi:hypothetical protein
MLNTKKLAPYIDYIISNNFESKITILEISVKNVLYFLKRSFRYVLAIPKLKHTNRKTAASLSRILSVLVLYQLS